MLVLGLTPALVADAIASERQNKTLHDLLVSRLRSDEIVWGKLAARLLSVAVFPALVLPVLSLVSLFGGVSPQGLFLGDLALASTAYFLASLAILASLVSRRPRDAVGSAYFLTAAWLFSPLLLDAILGSFRSPAPEIAHQIREVGEWIWPASPLSLVTNTALFFGGSADALWRQTAWMIASQAAYGTLFVALAAWLLRPSFRYHEGRAGRQVRSARVIRSWLPLRPCGDEPVYWKGAYFNRAAGGIGRRLAQTAVTAFLVVAVVLTLVASRDAFRELGANGYRFVASRSYDNRLNLNMGLRYGGSLLFGVWMLWLGGLTAAGISSEREQDTWTGLLATPMDGAEILRGKMLGALRSTAPFGVAIVALWLIGLVAGAVHPLGLLNALAALALFAWFITALGTYTSLISKATWSARAWTQGIVIVPHLCCFLPIPSILYLLGISLWSWSDIHALMSDSWRAAEWRGFTLLAAAYFFGGFALYGGAAYFLTRATFRKFDIVVDRPRRSPAPTLIPVGIEAVAPEEDPEDTSR